jgi:hypothetical protein
MKRHKTIHMQDLAVEKSQNRIFKAYLSNIARNAYIYRVFVPAEIQNIGVPSEFGSNVP